MDSPDCRVLADALAWHDANYAVNLFTVVQTWGSAPRPPGAVLAIREDGMVSGSVSGGCVEDDLVERTRSAVRTAKLASMANGPALINYGVTQQEAARFGLPCGGSLRLVQEPLSDTGWLRQLLERCANHCLVARTLNMVTGEVQLADAVRGQALQFDGNSLTTIYGPQWRLLLIGAGQLSAAVAQMASLLDFDVLVCDPREEYVNTFKSQLPGVQHVAGMPDDVVRNLVADARTAIVALTHDPKLDDMALLEALKSSAFYVGALGSRVNQQRRKQRLGEHFNLTEAELQRLHGPVGLRLGAKTPAEIAISILAEIVQVRNADVSALAREVGSCAAPQALS
jgi:xanthine dehydrogenase accessory factor